MYEKYDEVQIITFPNQEHGYYTFSIKYINGGNLNLKDNEYPVIYEIGGLNSTTYKWERYDFRVKATILFNSEKEFSNFPIQF